MNFEAHRMLKHSYQKSTELRSRDDDSDSWSSDSSFEAGSRGTDTKRAQRARKVWEQHTSSRGQNLSSKPEVKEEISEPVRSRVQESSGGDPMGEVSRWVGVGQDRSGVVMGEVETAAREGRGQRQAVLLFGLLLLVGLLLYIVLLYFMVQASAC